METDISQSVSQGDLNSLSNPVIILQCSSPKPEEKEAQSRLKPLKLSHVDESLVGGSAGLEKPFTHTRADDLFASLLK